jgi:hypothetical protein
VTQEVPPAQETFPWVAPFLPSFDPADRSEHGSFGMQSTAHVSSDGVDLVGRAATMDDTHIMVPNDTVEFIIGRGGETIKDLQAHSGCHFDILDETNIINGLRPINLIGSAHALGVVKDLILEIVESNSGDQQQQGTGSTGYHSGRRTSYPTAGEGGVFRPDSNYKPSISGHGGEFGALRTDPGYPCFEEAFPPHPKLLPGDHTIFDEGTFPYPRLVRELETEPSIVGQRGAQHNLHEEGRATGQTDMKGHVDSMTAADSGYNSGRRYSCTQLGEGGLIDTDTDSITTNGWSSLLPTQDKYLLETEFAREMFNRSSASTREQFAEQGEMVMDLLYSFSVMIGGRASSVAEKGAASFVRRGRKYVPSGSIERQTAGVGWPSPPATTCHVQAAPKYTS